MIYNRWIKNKQRCYCDGRSVLLWAFYIAMRIVGGQCGVVIFSCWLCIAGFTAKSCNDSALANKHAHRNCTMYDLLMQNVRQQFL